MSQAHDLGPYQVGQRVRRLFKAEEVGTVANVWRCPYTGEPEIRVVFDDGAVSTGRACAFLPVQPPPQ